MQKIKTSRHPSIDRRIGIYRIACCSWLNALSYQELMRQNVSWRGSFTRISLDELEDTIESYLQMFTSLQIQYFDLWKQDRVLSRSSHRCTDDLIVLSCWRKFTMLLRSSHKSSRQKFMFLESGWWHLSNTRSVVLYRPQLPYSTSLRRCFRKRRQRAILDNCLARNSYSALCRVWVNTASIRKSRLGLLWHFSFFWRTLVIQLVNCSVWLGLPISISRGRSRMSLVIADNCVTLP